MVDVYCIEIDDCIVFLEMLGDSDDEVVIV